MGDFERDIASARDWEIKVAAWARRRGWHVVPTYDFSGASDNKAPKLLAPTGHDDLVLPDLQCFKGEEFQWLEVKYKARADLHRGCRHCGTDPNHTSNVLCTGISGRLWNQYRRVQMVTTGEVFLMFLHEHEREVRGDSLSKLLSYVHHQYMGSVMGRSGMIFWEYDRIPLWGRLSMIDDMQACG